MREHTRCPTDRDLLGADLVELDEALADHLADCTTCAARVEELRLVSSLAQELPVGSLSEARASAIRDAILVRAGSATREHRRPERPRWWAPAFAAACVAVAALVLVVPRLTRDDVGDAAVSAPAEPIYRAALHPDEGARFVRLGSSPDEIVRLYEGTVTFEVEHLGEGERFRVVTSDGEVEVRGTIFEVRAVDDHLQGVRVLRGRVVVPHDDATDVVDLEAGERWSAADDLIAPDPVEAQGGTPDPVDSVAVIESAELPQPASPAGRVARPPVPVARVEPPISAHAHDRPAPTEVVQDGSGSAANPVPEPIDTLSATRSPTSTELRYQEGWGAMRAGDFGRAVSAFEGVLGDPASPLAEDAAYWRAVALGRAQRSAEAADAFREFVSSYESSPRRAESWAMLGWLLLETGDVEGARAAFEPALNSGVPRAQESARQGLSMIETRVEAAPPAADDR